MSTCRSCGAEVLWAETTGGKRIPLDPEPVAAGALLVVKRRMSPSGELVPLVRPVRRGEAPASPRYQTHFASCPDADRWRKP